MVPQLISRPAQPAHDTEALRRLALWAERFSPLVAMQDDRPGDEALLIDMTGAAHLFGGEAALLDDLRRRLAAAAIPARAALADTPAAAWALARHAPAAQAIAAPGETRAALADLPVEALRLEPTALTLLRRFGLRRLSDLYALPRAGLARRFRGEAGLRVVERLDKALGLLADPLIPQRPAPLYRSWRAFAEPLIDGPGVAAELPALAQALVDQLSQAGLGARRLSLTAFRVDGRTTGLEAGLSAPAADPAHLLRLLREKGLERLDLGFGVDALMLSADRAEPIMARQSLLHGEPDIARSGALAGLIDRLGARLGEGAIRRPHVRESWIPERSEVWARADPAAIAQAARFAEARPHQPRPLLLLDPPEPVEALAEAPDGPPIRFVWRRAPRRVVKAQGPERLAAEWWRLEADAGGKPLRTFPHHSLDLERDAGGKPLRPFPHPAQRTRDYYRIEDDQGRRYWLFRQGLYGREDADRAPDWWMHGLFP